MRERIALRRRCGLLATGVAIAWLASATSAQAVNVDAVTGPSGNSSVLDIGGWVPGERNAITVTPSGAVPDADAVNPAFPLAPSSVVVTDTATPLGDVSIGCVRINANSARCTALNGIHTVNASLGSGGGDSFTLDPGASGSLTPMEYVLQTSDGNDRVSIPASRDTEIWTLGGNDTISTTDLAGNRDLIKAGAGNDRIQLTSSSVATVDCGDGNDSAQVVGNPASTTDCEKVTPGLP
jgi:hypothetical protein